ncbi:Klaroid protein [Anthophora quadrimaculata]
MENERHYKLQSESRSRSRTPLVQSHAVTESEVPEHHYDLRSQSRERSRTPGEVRNNKKFDARILFGNSKKANDQTMEMIIEREKNITASGTLSEGENKRLENSSVSAKKLERRSERQKARRQIHVNGQTDSKADLCGHKNESCESTSPHKTVTSDYSSEEGERDSSNRPSSAHEIYKQAGDWWNVFPKTDYTYSERSQCRYEIAPGILAMPNMSRRSIHSNAEDFNQFSSDGLSDSGIYSGEASIEKEKGKTENCMQIDDEFHRSQSSNYDGRSKVQFKKTHREQYRCHREVIYTVPRTWTNSRSRQLLPSDSISKRIDSRKCDITSFVDSDAELEEVSWNNDNENGRISQLLMNVSSIIVLWFNKLLKFVNLKMIKRREYRDTYKYQRYDSKWLKVWQTVDRPLQYVYFFMVKVFFFDSWLLSRISSIRRWMHQRSPNIVWVALLPLLLLAGCWCLPCLSTLFFSTKVITRQFIEMPELVMSDEESFLKKEMIGNKNDIVSITENIESRVNSLENRIIEQSEHLLNISRALEQLRENEYVWSRYNNDISLLKEGRPEEHKLSNMYTQEIDRIKSEFEAVKELYSELKLCCNANTKYIGSEDLEKRIEMFLTNYFDVTLIPKKEEMKVEDRSSIGNINVVSDDRVREIVKEALQVYDADKTGRVDYALEPAGGQIISTRCTQRYDIRTRAFKLLAFTLYHENNNPRTVIQGNPIQPGVCWAFQGFPGYLLIKLRNSVYVTGFTVEHAPKSILPNGEMKSAPKKFNVWGFVDENDPEPVMFGDYEFAASADSLQYFPVQNTTIQTPYEYVELRVHSNHGQLEYTCLYRFRVHGKPF